MRIDEICTREVVTCGRRASAADIAQLMREHHVGTLVVTEPREEQQVPVGIITDRDLVVQVLARRVEPEAVAAEDMMAEPRTVAVSETVYDAIWHMRRHGIRRLPVVDEHGGLCGIVTADDLIQYVAEELTQLARVSPLQRHDEEERLVVSPS
jgi:signal-transduction protein with cAMP-binding, CBS, and nucleotidyltransferase domain